MAPAREGKGKCPSRADCVENVATFVTQDLQYNKEGKRLTRTDLTGSVFARPALWAGSFTGSKPRHGGFQ